jgi:hypothetical protein
MVACVWYAVGSADGSIACDDQNVTDKFEQVCAETEDEGLQREIRGWVNRAEYAEHTSVATKCKHPTSSISLFQSRCLFHVLF